MNFDEMLSEVDKELKEASRLAEELDRLQLTNPDSPRLKILKQQISAHLDSALSKTERNRERIHKEKEKLDRAERLSFDLQRQITTLCATLILALLALSEVFGNTEGMRAAVGDASSSFAYSVAASILAMLLSVGPRLDWSLLKVSSDAPWHERALELVHEYVGKTLSFLRLVASTAALWFLFDGLLDLARFLSGV